MEVQLAKKEHAVTNQTVEIYAVHTRSTNSLLVFMQGVLTNSLCTVTFLVEFRADDASSTLD